MSVKDDFGKTVIKTFRIQAKKAVGGRTWQYQLENLDGTLHMKDQWFAEDDLEEP